MENNPQQRPIGVFDAGPSGKSRGVCALLALFVGTLGIQYFYIGKNTAGIVFLLVTVLTCGFGAFLTGIVSLIQFVLMLTMTHEQFETKYVNNPSNFPIL